MKLRTELKNKVAGGVVAMGIDGSDVSHDLLAAHALLQALSEVKPYASYKTCTEYTLERADELMREWTNQFEV